MVINRDILFLQEQFDIKIPESTLIKLEDGIRNNNEMLVTIAASHYGFRNKNWCVYRHDTIKHDIGTFIAPKPKPIIEMHRPKTSQVFGHVIAADYKLTDYYDVISEKYDVEKLSTDEYIALMKDVILPLQSKDINFDGLAYLELVGRLNKKSAIQKVLDKEFLRVSIGAVPNRLICSECGADQTKKLCKHYGSKQNNIFMLAESLDYKELSFVDKPADPHGMITRIHDGIDDVTLFDNDPNDHRYAIIDAIPLKDFFELTDKTIVCVDNICTIINEGADIMKKNISYVAEFGTEKVTGILKTIDDTLVLTDTDLEDLSDRSFAIVQKSEDGISRRFPLNDEVSIKLAMNLLCDAEDLSPTEREKAENSISRSAKKAGIDFVLKVKEVSDSDSNEDTGSNDSGDSNEGTEDTELKAICDSFIEKLKIYGEQHYGEEGELKDAEKAPEQPSPLAVLFSILSSFASEVKYAGNMLGNTIDSYLQQLGKESIDKATKDSIQDEQTKLQDSLKELEEEVQLLTDQNIDLNKQLRDHFVEEIIAHKTAIGTLEDGETAQSCQYSKLGYEALKVILGDFRNMRCKLNDSTVNNSTSIKTITNPTQIADSITDTDNSDLSSPQDQKKVTIADAVEIINTLKARHGLQ